MPTLGHLFSVLSVVCSLVFEDSLSAAYSVGSLFFLLITLFSSIDISEVDKSFENQTKCVTDK